MYPTTQLDSVTLLLLAPLYTLVWALVTASFFLMPVWGTLLGVGWVVFTFAAIADALLEP
jgi:hypothetical protein